VKTRELFYVSNLLSISRILLVVPIYFLLRLETTKADYWAVFVMFVAGLTDQFDGRLARRWHQQTDLGRTLDPIADKIAVAVMAILLIQLRDLPLWFVVTIVARDLVILVLGLYIAYRTGIVVESNNLGKVTITAIAVVIVVYTLRVESVREIFLWVTVVLLAASSLGYLTKLKLLKQTRQA
jgi:CDP-diacylglycerol--glycerol-3-phosphate 3-phosphatidyltransferase